MGYKIQIFNGFYLKEKNVEKFYFGCYFVFIFVYMYSEVLLICKFLNVLKEMIFKVRLKEQKELRIEFFYVRWY